MKKFLKSKKFLIITPIVLALVTTSYSLADRYLIEHEEIPVSDKIVQNSAYAATNALNYTTSDSEAGDSTSSITDNSANETTDTGTDETTGNAVSDDWNYKSDSVSISIKKVQTGSGSDMVTYFVADVKLKDASDLLSAFAQNRFGRNIVETTSEIAEDNNAIFAINGDYYGFRTDGILIRNGKLYRDSATREGLAIYKNGTMKSYSESEVTSSELLSKGVLQTLSFGPSLIKSGTVTSDFENIKIDTNFGNRSIQDENPRTGIGMIEPNHFVFVVADGRAKNYSRGMTLTEFAEIFADLGCTEAYNLDGGGSSTMYFNGRVVNNPQGRNEERAISDILYIKK